MFCSCQSGLKANLYCTQGDKCPFSEQGYYCEEECANEEKHNHKPLSVQMLVNE